MGYQVSSSWLHTRGQSFGATKDVLNFICGKTPEPGHRVPTRRQEKTSSLATQFVANLAGINEARVDGNLQKLGLVSQVLAGCDSDKLSQPPTCGGETNRHNQPNEGGRPLAFSLN